MGWNNNTKAAEQPKTKPTVQDWMLFVFKQHEIKDANTGEVKYIKFECKMSSKPAEGNKYGAGMMMSVMAKVSGDHQTQINPDDYTKKWILVTGGIQLTDNINNNITYTNITIWADSVRIAPAKGG